MAHWELGPEAGSAGPARQLLHRGRLPAALHHLSPLVQHPHVAGWDVHLNKKKRLFYFIFLICLYHFCCKFVITLFHKQENTCGLLRNRAQVMSPPPASSPFPLFLAILRLHGLRAAGLQSEQFLCNSIRILFIFLIMNYRSKSVLKDNTAPPYCYRFLFEAS